MTEEEKKQLCEFRSSLDKSLFTNLPYSRRIEKPWGYEVHWVKDDSPYMGKLIHIDEDKRLSLQVHDAKLESWFVVAGQAIVMLENSKGEMEKIIPEAGKGYTSTLGQKHRIIGGKGGCDIIEVSTPETGNTYRLEDDYDRATETDEARQQRNLKATETN